MSTLGHVATTTGDAPARARMRKVSRGQALWGQAWTYLLIAIVVVVFMFPIYWIFITAMKPQEDVISYPPTFLPPSLTLEYFFEALDFRGGEAFINSLIVGVAVTIISVVLGALSGYAFARYRIGGFHLPFWILSIRMMPAVAAIIPLFLLFNSLGLKDTYVAVILTHLLIALPFAVWMMRGFFIELPTEVEEAALIDGCTQWQVFWRIALPMTAPGVAVTTLFCFIFSWNEFLFAFIVTQREATTLPVIISGLYSQHGVLWPVMASVALMGLVPVAILALVAQKHLVRGLTMGAVK